MALPLIYTPITKVQNSWSDVPGGQFCREYYMDFIRCASRVGWHRGQYECKKESADFSECIFHNKQLQRALVMEKERKRQKRAYIEPLGKDIAD